jgi:hypothetical protein
MDRDRADRLMAAALLRRNPDYARLRKREQVERAVEAAMDRLRQRRAWLEAYAAVVDDLLGDAWERATAGTCAVCGGEVRVRDLEDVLEELEADPSDEGAPRAPGPALVCPRQHVIHLMCIPLEIETAQGEQRIVGCCAVCSKMPE